MRSSTTESMTTITARWLAIVMWNKENLVQFNSACIMPNDWVPLHCFTLFAIGMSHHLVHLSICLIFSLSLRHLIGTSTWPHIKKEKSTKLSENRCCDRVPTDSCFPFQFAHPSATFFGAIKQSRNHCHKYGAHAANVKCIDCLFLLPHNVLI